MKLEDTIRGDMMKNKEVVSAVLGGTFFAIPYLALSTPIFPSLLIGAAAFGAGELVFGDYKLINYDDNYQNMINDTKEELLYARIVRIYDHENDFSLQLAPSAYNKLIENMNKLKL